MSLIIDALVNLWRLIRNARARLLGGPWDRRRRKKPTGVSNSARGPLTSIHTYSGGPPSRRARALRIRRQRFTRASMISDIWQYGTPQHEKSRMINSKNRNGY
jgi:hypothetical protein